MEQVSFHRQGSHQPSRPVSICRSVCLGHFVAIRRTATLGLNLLGDFCELADNFAAKNATKNARKLNAQLAGVRFLVQANPLAMLSTSLVECFVSTGIAVRSVNQLLVVLLDKIAGLQSAPAAGVETEDVLEVGSLFDPVI